MAKNLMYNLNNFQDAFRMLLDESGGEITPDIQLEIDKYEANEVGRAMTMKGVYDLLLDKAKLAKEKKDNFAKLQKLWERGAESIKQYLHDHLEKTGKKKLEEGTESISRRNSAGKVIIDELKDVPGQYKTYACKLNHQQMLVLKAESDFNADFDEPKYKIEASKSDILADFKKTKLEIKGTHIESGFTVTIKG